HLANQMLNKEGTSHAVGVRCRPDYSTNQLYQNQLSEPAHTDESRATSITYSIEPPSNGHGQRKIGRIEEIRFLGGWNAGRRRPGGLSPIIGHNLSPSSREDGFMDPESNPPDPPDEMLLRSEERYRLLVEGVRDYAIFMLDTSGRVVSWN